MSKIYILTKNMKKEASSLLNTAQRHLRQRLSLLETLVNQNSFTHNIPGVQAVQNTLEKTLTSLRCSTKRYPMKQRGDILIAETNPTSPFTVLLVGHADTVHPPTSNNKTFSKNDLKAHGDGIYDMKSGIAELVIVLDILNEHSALKDINLKIVINSAEEDTTPETCDFMKDIGRGAHAALVFEFGRDNNGIVTERKGMTEFWIHSKGKQSHSGNAFYDGVNAILPLATIIPEIACITNKEKNITANIGYIHGGTHLGVVPHEAKIGVEIRGCCDEDIDEALEKISRLIAPLPGLTQSILSRTSPLNKLPGTKKLLDSFIRSGQDFGITFSEMPRVGGISDANHISTCKIPTLDALGPTGGGAHTSEEYISLTSLEERAAIVSHFLLSFKDIYIDS